MLCLHQSQRRRNSLTGQGQNLKCRSRSVPEVYVGHSQNLKCLSRSKHKLQLISLSLYAINVDLDQVIAT